MDDPPAHDAGKETITVVRDTVDGIHFGPPALCLVAWQGSAPSRWRGQRGAVAVGSDSSGELVSSLSVLKSERVEVVHFADHQGMRIASHGGLVHIDESGHRTTLTLPRVSAAKQPLLRSRLARRALRLDKCNVLPCRDRSRLVVVWQGAVYDVDIDRRTWRKTLNLRNCRNPLHQSICQRDDVLVFGEYGANPERQPVPVYASVDDGRSWREVFTFPAGSIKHVHGVFFDPYEDMYWVATGDFAGENVLQRLTADFTPVDTIGDGSQLWRTCHVFFREDCVVWMMDSPLETSYVVRYDRATKTVERVQALPGPAWYAKELDEGRVVVGTACERGESVRDGFAHVFATDDLEHWWEVARFPHDGLPKGHLKNGVVAFADGGQSASAFWMFGEALLGLEGKSLLVGLPPSLREAKPTPQAHGAVEMDDWLRCAMRSVCQVVAAAQDASLVPEPAIRHEEPTFRSSTNSGLLWLLSDDDDAVQARNLWAYRMLRFVAVRRHQLKQRMRDKLPNREQRRWHVVLWAALLACSACETRDGRLINGLCSLRQSGVLRRASRRQRVLGSTSLTALEQAESAAHAAIDALVDASTQMNWAFVGDGGRRS